MTTQMRVGLQTHRMLTNQPTLEAGEAVTDVELTARDTLEMATIEGARALNMADEIGTLTPGKRADIVMVDASDFMTAPAHSPVQTVVFEANPHHIDTVLVDGEVVKRDGDLLNPKLETEYDRFVASGERLVDEAGLDL
jgi:cytosine/adenosine deaminase-related metal-dependent hydrolase